ncbi:hypothetical protein ACLB2K_051113 [Fragaria x ananassa]
MVHAQIIKSDVEGDHVHYNALVASYIKNGRRVYDMMLDTNIVVEDAEDIFQRTVEKDVVVFNAMIEGYRKSVGYAKKSFEVYIDMQRLNLQPNISTFASLTGACSVLAALPTSSMSAYEDQHIRGYKMASAFLDLYSKCGCMESV